MLKRILLASFILAQFLALNPASAENRKADAKKLLHEMQYDTQLRQMQQQSHAALDGIVNQMMAQFKNSGVVLDAKASKELKAALKTLARRVMNSWDPAVAERIYVNALDKGLPGDKLKKALAYYSTPEGQQTAKVFIRANNKLRAYVQQHMQSAMRSAIKDYLAQVEDIMNRQQERQKAAGAAKK